MRLSSDKNLIEDFIKQVHACKKESASLCKTGPSEFDN